jgi:hypothetical protein
MNENDLRDCFAMFALAGIIFKTPLGEAELLERRDEYGKAARGAYSYADAMLEARTQEPEPEIGIVAVKRRKKREERDA